MIEKMQFILDWLNVTENLTILTTGFILSVTAAVFLLIRNLKNKINILKNAINVESKKCISMQEKLANCEQEWHAEKENLQQEWNLEREDLIAILDDSIQAFFSSQELQQTLNSREQEWSQLQQSWTLEREQLRQDLTTQATQMYEEQQARETERQEFQQTLNSRQQEWNQLQQGWAIEREQLSQDLSTKATQIYQEQQARETERQEFQQTLNSREQEWNQLQQGWAIEREKLSQDLSTKATQIYQEQQARETERQEFQQTLNSREQEWSQLQQSLTLEREQLSQDLSTKATQIYQEQQARETERQEFQQTLNSREQEWNQLQKIWDAEREQLKQTIIDLESNYRILQEDSSKRVLAWQDELRKRETLECRQQNLIKQILTVSAEYEGLKKQVFNVIVAWQAERSECERLQGILQQGDPNQDTDRTRPQEHDNTLVQEINPESEQLLKPSDNESQPLLQHQEAEQGEQLPAGFQHREKHALINPGLRGVIELAEIHLKQRLNRLNGCWITTVQDLMTDRISACCHKVLGNNPDPNYLSQLIRLYPHVLIEYILFNVIKGINDNPNQHLKHLLSHALGLNEVAISRKHISAIKLGIQRVAQYPKNILRKLGVLAAEKRIKARIIESGIPFLGLIGSEMTVREQRAVQWALPTYRTIGTVLAALQENPALLATHITTEIMSGMGQEAINDVWPHIARAIGTEIVVADRNSLWQAFRAAIIQLGLEPSPQVNGTHYMVNEFLRQVGIPWAYIHDFVGYILDYADQKVLKENQGHEEIIKWQTQLANYCDIETIRRSVNLDTNAYYTRTYLQVRNSLPEHPTPLQQAMFQAMNAPEQQRVASNREGPYMAFDGDMLGIMLPGGNQLHYCISVDDQNPVQYDASTERRFCAVHVDLPQNVQVTWTDIEPREQHYALWPNQQDNHLLLFDAQGRYLNSATLNQPEAICLPVGKYQVLSRFQPNAIQGIEIKPISQQPALYCFYIALAANATLAISRAGTQALISVQTQDTPVLTVNPANRKLTLEGKELFWGGFTIEAYIPDAAIHTNYCLEFTSETTQQILNIPVNGKGAYEVQADALSNTFGHGLYQFKIRLFDGNLNRSVARQSLLYWSGLSAIDDNLTFHCQVWPDNLNRNRSFHVAVDPDHNQITPINQAERIQLAFDCGHRQPITLSWVLPAFFFIQQKKIQNDQEVIHKLRPGDTISVSEMERTRYTVTSSQAGDFCFGHWRERFDSTRRTTREFPASFFAGLVASYPGVNTLSFLVNGYDIPVFRIVAAPLFAEKMTKTCQGNVITLEFTMYRRLTGLTVTAQEMLTGQSFSFRINAADYEVGNNFDYGTAWLAQVETAHDHDKVKAKIKITFNRHQLLPKGAWLLRFSGQNQAESGFLQNNNSKLYAIGFFWSDNRINQNPVVLDNILDDEQSLEVLKRTHSALLPYYTASSWGTMHWVETLWRRQIHRWNNRIPEVLATLIDLAVERQTGLISLKHIGAVLPSLFAQRAIEYIYVNEESSAVSSAIQVLASITKHDVANHAASNAIRANGFNMQAYIAHLAANPEPDFDDAPIQNGEWLGSRHYKKAIHDLAVQYNNTPVVNNIMRGQCLLFCRNIKLVMPFLPVALENIQNIQPHVNLWPEIFNNEEQINYEHRIYLSHCLSLLAYHCRQDARQSGTLQNFIEIIGAPKIDPNQHLENHLSYLLQVGDSLFAYYLLLWEFVLTAENNP